MKLNNKNNRHNIVSAFALEPIYGFDGYAKGYHNSAKLLAEIFISKDGYRDYDGYPIVFMYRHALELNIKNVIYWGQRLSNIMSNDTFGKDLYNNHNLIILSEVSTKLLTKIFPHDQELKEFCSKIIIIANEYSTLDKDSYSYRYPIDKKGNYSTPKHQVVNIESIYLVMEEILTAFEAINFGLDIETDKKFDLIEILNQLNMN